MTAARSSCRDVCGCSDAVTNRFQEEGREAFAFNLALTQEPYTGKLPTQRTNPYKDECGDYWWGKGYSSAQEEWFRS